MNEISLAVIAFGFLLLVIFIIITLVHLQKTLKSVNNSLLKIDLIIPSIQAETTKMLKTTNEIAEDAQSQIKKFDALFNAIHNVSLYLENLSEKLKTNKDKDKDGDGNISLFSPSFCSNNTTEDQPKPSNATVEAIQALAELASIGIILFQNFKKRSKTHE